VLCDLLVFHELGLQAEIANSLGSLRPQKLQRSCSPRCRSSRPRYEAHLLSAGSGASCDDATAGWAFQQSLSDKSWLPMIGQIPCRAIAPIARPLIRERSSRFAQPSTSFGLQMHFGLSRSPPHCSLKEHSGARFARARMWRELTVKFGVTERGIKNWDRPTAIDRSRIRVCQVAPKHGETRAQGPVDCQIVFGHRTLK
jgi:hypothetical protein